MKVTNIIYDLLDRYSDSFDTLDPEKVYSTIYTAEQGFTVPQYSSSAFAVFSVVDGAPLYSKDGAGGSGDWLVMFNVYSQQSGVLEEAKEEIADVFGSIESLSATNIGKGFSYKLNHMRLTDESGGYDYEIKAYMWTLTFKLSVSNYQIVT